MLIGFPKILEHLHKIDLGRNGGGFCKKYILVVKVPLSMYTMYEDERVHF